MIIKFSDEIEKFLLSDNCEEKDYFLLSKLFISMIDNKIIVYFSKIFLNEVRKRHIFDKYIESFIVDFLIGHYTEFYSHYLKYNYYAIITNDEDTKFIARPFEHYEIPFKEIKIFLNLSIFACEDLSDCEFYLWLYKQFSNYNEDIMMERHSFGGNFCKNIDLLIKKRTPLFIVSDSDKEYRDSQYNRSSIAYHLENVWKIHKSSQIFNYYILEVRNKENTIPLKLVEKFNKKMKKENLLKLIELSKNNKDIALYFNVKSGIKESCYNSKNKNNEYIKINKDIYDFAITNNFLNGKNLVGIGDKICEEIRDYYCENHLSLTSDIKNSFLIEQQKVIDNLVCNIFNFGIVYNERYIFGMYGEKDDVEK